MGPDPQASATQLPRWVNICGGGNVSGISNLGRRAFFKRTINSMAGVTAATPLARGSQDPPKPNVYSRIEAHLRSVTAIDVHDHLRPPNILEGYVDTARGQTGFWSRRNLVWICMCCRTRHMHGSSDRGSQYITALHGRWKSPCPRSIAAVRKTLR